MKGPEGPGIFKLDNKPHTGTLNYEEYKERDTAKNSSMSISC